MPAWVGEAFSPAYFQTPDLDLLDYSVSREQSEYQCTDCGQAWYGEAEPGETGELRFAMKISSLEAPPSDDAVAAAKELLCVIAHGGFEESPCRSLGCANRSLLGRYLCHVHFSFG